MTAYPTGHTLVILLVVSISTDALAVPLHKFISSIADARMGIRIQNKVSSRIAHIAGIPVITLEAASLAWPAGLPIQIGALPALTLPYI